MTNFDFLKREPQFSDFADLAIAAEKLYAVNAASCVASCRMALEATVKWMYAVENLAMPWDDKLATLLGAQEFRQLIAEFDPNLWKRLDRIRLWGNDAAHNPGSITQDTALLCLMNLHAFMDAVSYSYSTICTAEKFDKALLTQEEPAPVVLPQPPAVDIEALRAQIRDLQAQLEARRKARVKTYTPKDADISEFDTRRLYVDAMLRDAGWIEGKNWVNELEVTGMPDASGRGYADYALYADDGRVLAIIEAKRCCRDVSAGRIQAGLYADCIEKKQGFRPVIFLTNGFDTRIIDTQYPERRISTIWSKRDLEKWFNLLHLRTGLSNVFVDTNIAGRYYQIQAVKAVCDSFGRENRRKALLVMATGSGKTRTVIALTKVLLEQGWIRNVLFLADRTVLVRQAKNAFAALLPELSVSNLCDGKADYTAHGIFSTYQTMFNCIDTVEDAEGRLFTCGHFDLIICDEAHRSIYNRYKAIFDYFDAPLVGLTATPKDEVGHNTYALFDLEDDIPTYGYELAQAVADGFLAPYMSIETQTKFMSEGITYADLTPEQQEEYEEKFADESDDIPENIAASALNAWVFNEDTIRKVLNALMTQGLKVDGGNRIGKTIIFAKSHRHAEKILEIFNSEYPNLLNYAQVIDNYMVYAQGAIDKFSTPDELPQIAISVDMLDTGIDVPEVLNLVMFKKVMSKAKFWQMIGRGTRLCKGLIDGEDKKHFYIFDFCGNFEFFRMEQKSDIAPLVLSVSGEIFADKAFIAYKLQDYPYSTEWLEAYRQGLVSDMLAKVRELNRDNFAVKLVLQDVEHYAVPENYDCLSYGDYDTMVNNLGPLIEPDLDEWKALAFDALIYKLIAYQLSGNSREVTRCKHTILKKAAALYALREAIPEIGAQTELLEEILNTKYLESAGIPELEHIRTNLRDLMKYIPVQREEYVSTHFTDELPMVEPRPADLDDEYLRDYKTRAEAYVRNNQDEPAIAKLKNNIPLTAEDIADLERILWSEVGTREDYIAQIGNKSLGVFVREIVGLDMGAAKAAFAAFLDETRLDSDQIYFVNQIVEFIVKNGLMPKLEVLQGSPFTDHGNVYELFGEDKNLWKGIMDAIAQVNDNAATA